MKPENVSAVRSNRLLARLEIDDLNVIVRKKGFVDLDTLNDPVEQLTIKTVYNMQIEGKCGPGRPNMT